MPLGSQEHPQGCCKNLGRPYGSVTRKKSAAFMLHCGKLSIRGRFSDGKGYPGASLAIPAAFVSSRQQFRGGIDVHEPMPMVISQILK